MTHETARTKIDKNLYEANIKLLDENTYLKADNRIANEKLESIVEYIDILRGNDDIDNNLKKHLEVIEEIINSVK